MSDFQKIRYHVEAGVARILLNRPEKRNALDAEVIAELATAFSRAAEDQDARVVLLSGAGPDFCSGADLSMLERAFHAGVMEQLADARHLADLFLMMRRHPRTIVAAVRGRALAGGCGLATACDIVLASESAHFGYPEVNIGFVPAIVMAMLRRSMPERRAFELVATGEQIGAEQARDYGLVNRVLEDSAFDLEVDSYVGKLAGKSGSAANLTKQLLYQMDAQGFEQALDAGVQVNAIARLSEDCRRGIAKFLRKD